MPKQPLKTVIRTACALAMLGITPSYALERIRDFVPNAQKVGEGRLTYMLWHVYDAELYAPQGLWEKDQPFALRLSYLMDIKGRKIADRSIEEMRSQGGVNEVKLAAWHAQMRRIFPDVREGTSITGVYTKKGEAIFYTDDIEAGRIKDPEFSRAFFGIWLNEKTSAPDLRQKLLGSI